mmetsp:Transcript_87367/g.251929  ORF Transcript_87367/g.251929 Transcript_87367/m.251929 type:complete len:261 (-) Transcript_87367:1923-2705(-)
MVRIFALDLACKLDARGLVGLQFLRMLLGVLPETPLELRHPLADGLMVPFPGLLLLAQVLAHGGLVRLTCLALLGDPRMYLADLRVRRRYLLRMLLRGVVQQTFEVFDALRQRGMLRVSPLRLAQHPGLGLFVRLQLPGVPVGVVPDQAFEVLQALLHRGMVLLPRALLLLQVVANCAVMLFTGRSLLLDLAMHLVDLGMQSLEGVGMTGRRVSQLPLEELHAVLQRRVRSLLLPNGIDVLSMLGMRRLHCIDLFGMHVR